MPMMPEKMDSKMGGKSAMMGKSAMADGEPEESAAPPTPPPQAPPAPSDIAAQLAAESPALPKPVAAKRITALVAQFNKTVEAMGGKDPQRDEVPDLLWESAEPKVADRFPPEVYVPMAVLNLAVQNTAMQAGMPQLAKKYDLDLAGLTTNEGIAYSTAVLKKMAGDKRLTEIMHNPPAAPKVEEKGEKAPSASDVEMMAGM